MQLTLTEMKIPLAGAACALAVGLLLGGALKPHPGETIDGPVGPQIIAETGGARSDGSGEGGVTLASYRGPTPDYVLGTDWKRSMAWPPETAAVSPRAELAREDAPPEPERAVLTRTTYEELARPAPGYPSLGGARSADDHAVNDDSVDSDPDAAR